MDKLLEKVKANLILEHSEDDALLKMYIDAAVSYAESYQHIPEGSYSSGGMPPTTQQAVIMLASHFYESMSYGKMKGFALIKQLYKQKDADGFTKDAELILAKVRCYREGRHGSARWANLSTFTQATDMFRFRVIPDVTVTPDLYIDYQGERFKILSVENIRGRGMYLEILAEKVESCIG